MKRARVTWGHALLATSLVMLAAVAAGTYELWGMFDAERTEAEARVADEARLIEEAARTVLIDDLEKRLALARLHAEAMHTDAMADDEGLILATDGKQFMPRLLTETPAEASFTRHLDEQIRRGDKIVVMGAIGEMLERARAVVAAKNDDGKLVAAVRDYLEHRSQLRTSDATDVIMTLIVVDTLLDRGDADPQLLRALLRDGTKVGSARVQSVQSAALNARRFLDPVDAKWVHDTVVAHSARAGVDSASFSQRWRDLERPPLSLPPVPSEPIGIAVPELPDEIVLLRGTAHATSLEGIRIGRAEAQRFVESDLRKRSLLRDDETIDVTPAGDTSIVHATLLSPRLDAARARIAERDEAKRTLLIITTLLAFGIVFAAGAELRRRKRYEDLRTGFLAAVSHELRTPLASMRLIVDSLVARLSTVDTQDARTVERLSRLGRDVDGLDFLVENVLSFSRLERGRLDPRRDRTSLAEIVAEVSDLVRSTAGDDVDLQVTVENECVLAADPELIGLVVANLARNAWQHNPKPREQGRKRVDVRVALSNDGKIARVDVSDDGPGIATSDRERIFEEFVRGARPTTRGTGLGLALCRQIARVHGGDVTLTATSSAGSTFTLTVPARS
jgi:two-component system, OmpR family, sensor histidine kinase SenX3